jgi:tetratricopeptide (TPR) repeat protein
MLTRHQLPLAAQRGLAVLFTAAYFAAPVIHAQSAATFTDYTPSAFYSAGMLDLSQGMPAHSTVLPQLQTNTAYGLTSMSPEMQGDLLMVHQRYLAAIDAYRRAPHESAVVWNKLGIAYQHMYAMDFAKLQYEKALSIEPKYPEALNNLGTVYYGEKNYHKAEVYYRKAIRFKPDTASFYSNLGTAYFSDHRYKQGIEAYRQAFSLDPEVFIRESLERIAEMGPIEEQARLNYALAKIYAQAGNVKAAIAYLRAALNEGFDDRKKIMGDKELAGLRETAEFRLLLTEEHMNDQARDQAHN